MPRKKKKTEFVGVKMTAEQAALLSDLQSSLDSATKTEVILQGLDLMGRLYSSHPAVPAGTRVEVEETPVAAGILELSQLEAEIRRHDAAIRQITTRSKEVMRQMAEELADTDAIVEKYGAEKSNLIQILLEIQRRNNWLSEGNLRWVSRKLDVPLAQTYHVATFYKAFSLVPKGRHSISVCLGTACQVRGASRLLDRVVETFKIKPGETSSDMRFSLDTVNCLGCCALGPVMMVDDEYYSKPSKQELERLAAAE
jgi:NADH-quinone oxidoreductase subunit E